MIRPVSIAVGDRELSLAELRQPLNLDHLVPGSGPWVVELGFGKGRFLLERAQGEPERRWVGIEVASAYYRRVCRGMRRRGLTNLVLVRGEALYLLSAVLPKGFATAVHVYFPDPWPKSRHHKRRLFDVETVDLVVELLEPGGRLYFATDFLDYGRSVHEMVVDYPGLEVKVSDGPRPNEPPTHYEAKYHSQGRPILYLEVRCSQAVASGRLHPDGAPGVMAATWRRQD